MTKSLIKVGVIAGPHGIQGQVCIKSFTEEPMNLTAYGPLYKEDGSLLELKIIRSIKKKNLIASLSTVKTRNEAEGYRGIEIFIEKDCLPILEKDEYYYSELIGLTVLTIEEKKIGKVINVDNYGAGDIFDISLENGKMATIPFREGAIISIDPDKAILTIDPKFLLT